MDGHTRSHPRKANAAERYGALLPCAGGARRCVWMGKLLSLVGSAKLIEVTVAHAAHMASLAGAIKSAAADMAVPFCHLG